MLCCKGVKTNQLEYAESELRRELTALGGRSKKVAYNTIRQVACADTCLIVLEIVQAVFTKGPRPRREFLV
jgi:hypothetical protein